jgi:hypothetical protein
MKVLSILFLTIAGASAAMPNAAPAEANAMTNNGAEPDFGAAAPAQEADPAAAAAAFHPNGPPPPQQPPTWPQPPRECRPGTYSCTVTNNGWRVCDVSGHWVVSNFLFPDIEDEKWKLMMMKIVCWLLLAQHPLPVQLAEWQPLLPPHSLVE